MYPALEPGENDREFDGEHVSSGVPAIAELLHGGIERGSVSIISGPTGVGKTTLGTQFMKEAAGRGERSVLYLFEESTATFLSRSEAINIWVGDMIERGTLDVIEVEALERSPQEFAGMVREEVEERDAQIVMIDGISGYRLTLRGEQDMMLQRMHALGRYLILSDRTVPETALEHPVAVRRLQPVDSHVFPSDSMKSKGVTSIFVDETENVTGEFSVT